MTSYKKASQCLSILCLFIGFQAQADEAICNNANSAIQKLSDKDRIHDTMMGVKPTYQAKVAEGFLYGGESGLLFKENKIVSWGEGDLLVIHPKESEEQVAKGEKNPTKFFIQYDKAPYDGVNDKGTKGGIYKVESKGRKSDRPGVSCVKDETAYAHHFFPKENQTSPEVGDIYCVRTREGDNYALIKVTNVCGNGVVFDYKYNGKSNVFVGEKESSLQQKLSSNTSTKRISSQGKR